MDNQWRDKYINLYQKLIVCFPHPPGAGGPGSFQSRFEKELTSRGFKIQYADSISESPSLIFVVGGTKRLLWLKRMRNKGIPVLYRLDGINWLHWKKKVGLRNFVMSEYRNWSNRLIHAFLADYIVYQSLFTKRWWDSYGLRRASKFSIIHNGVDVDLFQQRSTSQREIALVCLEGTLDYSPYAISLLNDLAGILPKSLPIKMYGRFEFQENRNRIDKSIEYHGPIKITSVPDIMVNAIYLSLDINPACPNTVAEAMACGAPVVGFDTGALSELIPKNCGEVVPFGSDPWKLGKPDVNALVVAIRKVHDNYQQYSHAARQYAYNNYDIKKICSSYLEVIQSIVKN